MRPGQGIPDQWPCAKWHQLTLKTKAVKKRTNKNREPPGAFGVRKAAKLDSTELYAIDRKAPRCRTLLDPKTASSKKPLGHHFLVVERIE